MTAWIGEVPKTRSYFTQKIGRCQNRDNPLQGSKPRFDPVCLHGGGIRKRIERSDPMSESQLPMWQRWAQFRFSVVGELLSCPPPKGQLQQAIGQLAQKSYRHPTNPNQRICFGPSTIERWYYKAKDAADPIAVLGRKIRSDSGVRWSMPEVILQELKSQYEHYPVGMFSCTMTTSKWWLRSKPTWEPFPATKRCYVAYAKTGGLNRTDRRNRPTGRDKPP